MGWLFSRSGLIGLLIGVLTYAPLINTDYKVIGANHSLFRDVWALFGVVLGRLIALK